MEVLWTSCILMERIWPKHWRNSVFQRLHKIDWNSIPLLKWALEGNDLNKWLKATNCPTFCCSTEEIIFKALSPEMPETDPHMQDFHLGGHWKWSVWSLINHLTPGGISYCVSSGLTCSLSMWWDTFLQGGNTIVGNPIPSTAPPQMYLHLGCLADSAPCRLLCGCGSRPYCDIQTLDIIAPWLLWTRFFGCGFFCWVGSTFWLQLQFAALLGSHHHMRYYFCAYPWGCVRWLASHRMSLSVLWLSQEQPLPLQTFCCVVLGPLCAPRHPLFLLCWSPVTFSSSDGVLAVSCCFLVVSLLVSESQPSSSCSPPHVTLLGLHELSGFLLSPLHTAILILTLIFHASFFLLSNN